MAPPKMRSEFPLILASVFIAAVIWLIAKQADYEPDRLQAAVVLNNIPATMTVEAPNKLAILVQYPKRFSNMIVERNFSVPINIEAIFGLKPEEQWDPRTPVVEKEYQLRPSNVKSNNLDSTIQVVSVDPESITLKARLRTQWAKVEVDHTGKLPDDLLLLGTEPEPSKLQFAGSVEALAKLAAANNTVKTTPIDLSKLHASGQLMPHIVLPDPALKLLGQRNPSTVPTVIVNVAVSERPRRQVITGVPITLVTFAPNIKAKIDPPTASVVVEGPESALKSIGAADIEFSPVRELDERPGRVSEVGLVARLKTSVPGEIAKQIKIVEIRPSQIAIEFVSLDKQNK